MVWNQLHVKFKQFDFETIFLLTNSPSEGNVWMLTTHIHQNPNRRKWLPLRITVSSYQDIRDLRTACKVKLSIIFLGPEFFGISKHLIKPTQCHFLKN